MYDLTDKQKECLIIINLLTKRHGYPPTVREIGREMGTRSSATAFHHIKKLKEKGYIKWEKGNNRTIKIIK